MNDLNKVLNLLRAKNKPSVKLGFKFISVLDEYDKHEITYELNELVEWFEFYNQDLEGTLEEKFITLKFDEYPMDMCLNFFEISFLPKYIGLFNLVEFIDLSNNRLEELPESFGWLDNLKCVVLNDNHFSKFPEVLINLPNLYDLRIASNPIESLHGLDLSSMGLTYLYMKNTSMGDLCNLPSGLKTLYLTHNKVNDLTPISKLESLVHLYLGDSIAKLPDLSKLSELQTLCISDHVDISEIPKHIGLKLETLVIWGLDEIKRVCPIKQYSPKLMKEIFS